MACGKKEEEEREEVDSTHRDSTFYDERGVKAKSIVLNLFSTGINK